MNNEDDYDVDDAIQINHYLVGKMKLMNDKNYNHFSHTAFILISV